MTRVLAVADEESDLAYGRTFAEMRPDLIVACGDLSYEYLEYLVTTLNKPLLYVLGNHDPPARTTEWQPPVPLGLSFQEKVVRPEGCTSVEGRVEDVSGLRIAGLGGSFRYSDGPNQYTEEQMRRRCARLAVKSRLPRRRGKRPIDVLVTHAPPFGLGDGDDVCHRGFRSFHRLVTVTSPHILVHGHIHPYGRENGDRKLGSTTVVNAVAYRLLEITP
jgi:Icc-related predicted phosphoesterase